MFAIAAITMAVAVWFLMRSTAVVPPLLQKSQDIAEVAKNDVRDPDVAGTPIGIQRRIKLPEETPIGDFCFRDEKSFGEFLGPKNKRFLKWNNVDFSRQMVLISCRVYATGGTGQSICSVERLTNEVCVLVETTSVNFSVQAVSKVWSGVVVNRTELPIRFHYKEP
jgi:hypothetical protein